MDFPGKNTETGSHFLLQGNLSNPGIKPASAALAGGFFTTEPPGKPYSYSVQLIIYYIAVDINLIILK